ncbi:MAG: SEC-C metal-binding domain-containing protein [Rhodoferax sp.]
MYAPNEPCLCGSGKKYKHCCGSAEAIQSLAAVPAGDVKPQAGAIEKAMEWLANRHRKGWQVCFERLRDELLSPQDLEKLAQLDQETLSGIQVNLTEWLLAEGEIQVQGSMRRISDYLIGPSGPDWTAGQRDWLQQMGQRPLRLYNVTEVVKAQGMTLCDTLNADSAPMVVQERAGSLGLEPGMHLGCRVMRVGEHFELSGGAYPFSMLHGPAVAERLRATDAEFGHLPGLAHEQGRVLMATWLQQFVAPPPMPQMIDHYSGEPIVAITDRYRVLDWDALSGKLQSCADVEGNRQEGWSRIIDCEDGQIRPLAHINLGKKPDQIEIYYKTQRYADQGRPWFNALAAGTVTYMRRKVETPQDLINKRTRPGARASSAANAPVMDPVALTRAMNEVVLRTYAHWADEPIPALNNKTPRQAIQTAAGLERVKGLLRSYESGEKTQAAQQRRPEVSYDFLWESLGLAR